MKTLLLFIGTVLRSRIIQRKGLEALPAIYKLILYWWSWTPPLPKSQVSAVAEHQKPSGIIAIGCVKAAVQQKLNFKA